MNRKYFGTDGIRGRVGTDPMTADFAMRLASAAAQALVPEGGTVLIGKDTRLSGYMFESALEAGFVAAGVDVLLLGPQCVDTGIGKDLLVVDPGFGFGKTPAHNVELLGNLRQLQRIGCPVLIGVSRKSTLGVITGRDVDDLLPASIAAAVAAVMHGAQIVRAHDVAETVDALGVARRLIESGKNI